MKIIIVFIKWIISFFAYFIKKSKDSKEYLFSIALKKEVKDFIENGYYLGYNHIEKSIEIAKKYYKGGNEYIIADVGGSVGATALMYSKAFNENVVYVFEPIQESFSNLKERIKNAKNIVPVNKALGNEIGKTTINVAKRISSSSLFDLKADTSSNIFSNALIHERKEEIEISTLDNEIPKEKNVLILKIDVQGFELEVLKGGKETLKKTVIVLLEMSNHEGYTGSPKYFAMDEYLRSSGFCLYDILPSTRDKGQLVEWDSIYINQKNL